MEVSMLKLQLSFHTTFALKKEDMIKILTIAAEEKGLDGTPEELIRRTTLGNKKVTPIKSWATRAGLIKNKRLSPEGEIVWDLDPHLSSNITDWLMHFYLSFGDKGLEQPPDNPAEWGGWSYFVYAFVPQHGTFTIEDLVQHSALVFEKQESKKLTTNFRMVLRAYTEQQALASCQFIQKLQTDKFCAGNTITPNSYMVGYLLAKLWERDFDTQTSVLTEAVINKKWDLLLFWALEQRSYRSS